MAMSAEHVGHLKPITLYEWKILEWEENPQTNKQTIILYSGHPRPDSTWPPQKMLSELYSQKQRKKINLLQVLPVLLINEGRHRPFLAALAEWINLTQC